MARLLAWLKATSPVRLLQRSSQQVWLSRRDISLMGDLDFPVDLIFFFFKGRAESNDQDEEIRELFTHAHSGLSGTGLP